MFSRKKTVSSTNSSCKLQQAKEQIAQADAILIGAGSGLSTAASLTYDGERFERLFGDFGERYGITDMYSGGFYPFDTLEEYWAWWSRHVCYNRYDDSGVPLYRELLSLVAQKDYFVLTTNVDHCFQKAGFDKQRLFYTQGDYGLFQCSRPCRQETYDNEAAIRAMVQQQRDMRIPSSLIPDDDDFHVLPSFLMVCTAFAHTFYYNLPNCPDIIDKNRKETKKKRQRTTM